jgi:hypothetical protein
MDRFFDQIDAWLVALAFAATMLGCWGLGRWWGQRTPIESAEDPGSKFIDASLALLGLLLAFTFSIALGRYDQRRQAVVAESNAIGDFYTCASLLPEPHRPQLQKVIQEYALVQRNELRTWSSEAEEHKSVAQSNKLTTEMTLICAEAIAGNPIAVSLTNTLNNLTSSTAARLAVYEERLSWGIVALLLLVSVLPSFLIGEKQGATRRVHLSGTLSYIVLVPLVLFVTLDLNQPRRGLIRVSLQPLERVIESIGPVAAREAE